MAPRRRLTAQMIDVIRAALLRQPGPGRAPEHGPGRRPLTLAAAALAILAVTPAPGRAQAPGGDAVVALLATGQLLRDRPGELVDLVVGQRPRFGVIVCLIEDRDCRQAPIRRGGSPFSREDVRPLVAAFASASGTRATTEQLRRLMDGWVTPYFNRYWYPQHRDPAAKPDARERALRVLVAADDILIPRPDAPRSVRTTRLSDGCFGPGRSYNVNEARLPDEADLTLHLVAPGAANGTSTRGYSEESAGILARALGHRPAAAGSTAPRRDFAVVQSATACRATPERLTLKAPGHDPVCELGGLTSGEKPDLPLSCRPDVVVSLRLENGAKAELELKRVSEPNDQTDVVPVPEGVALFRAAAAATWQIWLRRIECARGGIQGKVVVTPLGSHTVPPREFEVRSASCPRGQHFVGVFGARS